MLSAAAAGQLCGCNGWGDPTGITTSPRLLNLLAHELGYETLGHASYGSITDKQRKARRAPPDDLADYWVERAVELLDDWGLTP